MEILKLVNFGFIRNFELKLGNIVILSGEPIGFKNSLAKLIAIFRHWEYEGKLIDYKLIFEHFSILNYISADTRIEYESDLRKIIFNGKHFSTESKIDKIDEKIRIEEILKKQVIGVIQSALDEGGANKNPAFLYNKLSNININLENIVHIPVQRTSVSVFSDVFMQMKSYNLPIQKEVIDFADRFEKAKNEMLELNIKPFNIKYKYESKEFRLYNNNNKYQKLSNCNSDIQALFPMLLVLEYYFQKSKKGQNSIIKNISKICFLIEEPELQLPFNQYSAIINKILNLCDIKSNDLIITTNQNEILSLLEKVLPEAKIYNLNKGEIIYKN